MERGEQRRIRGNLENEKSQEFLRTKIHRLIMVEIAEKNYIPLKPTHEPLKTDAINCFF